VTSERYKGHFSNKFVRARHAYGAYGECNFVHCCAAAVNAITVTAKISPEIKA
jgi:hypothetical protein